MDLRQEEYDEIAEEQAKIPNGVETDTTTMGGLIATHMIQFVLSVVSECV
jgi:hypothetical protein